MYYTIYKITCHNSGWIYIGKHQTKDLQDGYMGSGKLLQEAHKHYGLENFSKEILYVFDTEEEMNAKEAELVTEEFCLRDDTYNICPGGKGGWGYINSNGKRNGFETSLKDVSTRELVREAGKRGGASTKLKFDTDKDWAKDHSGRISTGLKNAIKDRGTHWSVGKKHSDATKRLIGDKSKVSQSGKSNSQYGTCWITNEVENKKISKELPVPEGWRRGRK